MIRAAPKDLDHKLQLVVYILTETCSDGVVQTFDTVGIHDEGIGFIRVQRGHIQIQTGASRFNAFVL